ncbi:MAG: hypothetical protein LBO67_03530 [Spirochaetaceae bacterium]|nr:hypothetical protein [Spirochaetaceae bacterium]
MKSNRAEIDQFAIKQKGKVLANTFLDGKESSFQKIFDEMLKTLPKTQHLAFKQGAFDAFIEEIILPSSKNDEKRLFAVGKGLATIVKDERFAALYKHFSQIISRYLEELSQCEENARLQYEPQLRQKEEELSRRYGQTVTLDPLQDPDFIKLYQQSIHDLNENYTAIVNLVREQILLLFSF